MPEVLERLLIMMNSVVFGMPREAIDRDGAGVVVPDRAIAGEIVKAVEGKK